MVRGLCPRDIMRWVAEARSSHRGRRGCGRSGQTTAANPTPAFIRTRGVEDAAPYGGCETYAAAYGAADAVSPRLPMVRGLRPRDWMRWAVDARSAHRLPRGQNRSSRTAAANAARQSRKHGASRTPPLTGGCETYAARCDETGAISIRPQMVRGLCPRNINRWSVNARLTHRGKYGQNRSGLTTASNAAGSHANAVHRGRCTLHIAAKPRLRHET